MIGSADGDSVEADRRGSRTYSFWWRFRRRRGAVVSLAILLVLCAGAALAPLVSPYNPNSLDLENTLSAPTWIHLFGTDNNGRDLLARCLYGGRISLSVGIVAMLVAMSIGTLVGATAGYFGGVIDGILMRFVDIMLAIPTFFLLIIVSTMFQPSALNIMVVIGLFSWTYTARIVRGEFLALREREYIEAARAIGTGGVRIILRHLLPNAFGTITVQATLTVGYSILTESALSYLGLGIQPPLPSWGNLLTSAQEYVLVAPWLVYPPGILIAVTVLCIFIIGNTMRDVVDPRIR
jgi:peptide/nickel transport system permease protein